MSNIHNITAESVQSISTVKSKGAGLSRSRQDFNIAAGNTALNSASEGKGVAASKQAEEVMREALQAKGEAVRSDIISRALFEAGIEQNEFTMEVVNAHINNFMPLTKENLERLILQSKIFDNTSLDILIMLNKAGIESTAENIAQMERHVMDNSNLTEDLVNLLDIYTDFISSPVSEPRQALNFASLILKNILPENNRSAEEYVKTAMNSPVPEDIAGNIKQEDFTQLISLSEKLGSNLKFPLKAILNNMADILHDIENKSEAYVKEKEMPVRNENISAAKGEIVPAVRENNADLPESGGGSKPAETNVLKYGTEEKLKTLIGLKAKNQEALMSKIKELVDETVRSGNANEVKTLKEMLGSNLLKKILKNEISEKWFIEPKSLTGQEIKNKYNEINNDLKKILSNFYGGVNESGGLKEKLMTQALNIRDNLNFISQFSKESFFMELPLKFENQNATGEIYVLSEKRGKKKYQNGESVNVLLKLTLDRIGELDIFLTLQGKMVNSKFLSSDDGIISLITDNITELRGALNEKGYSFHSKVTKEDSSFDFAKDFINKNTSRIKFKPHGFKMRI